MGDIGFWLMNALILPYDTCHHGKTIWPAIIEVEEVIESVIREGSLGPDDKFLIDIAFTLTHPVNLADRQFHSLSQFG